MNLGWVVLGFGLVLTVAVALPALLLTLAQLAPGAVARAEDRIDGGVWRCFGAGLVAAAPLTLAFLLLLNSPAAPLQLIGWALLLAALTCAALGAAGLARLVGRRLSADSSGGATRRLLRGAVALELAALVPFVGWLIIAPLLLLLSLGAILPALHARAARVEGDHAAQPS